MIEPARLRLLAYAPDSTIHDALTALRKDHAVVIVRNASEAQERLQEPYAHWDAAVASFGRPEALRQKSKQILSLAEEFDIPSVALAELGEEGAEAGRHADAVVDKTATPLGLAKAIQKARQSRQGHVLIMDSEDRVARFFAESLKQFNPIILADTPDALVHIQRHHPRIAAAIIDIDARGGHMNQIYRELCVRNIPYLVTYASAEPNQNAILKEFRPKAILMKQDFSGLKALVKEIKRPIN